MRKFFELNQLVLTLSLVGLFAGCQAKRNSTELLNTTAQTTAPACDRMDATATADLNGAEIFELTSNCLFDREVHDVRIRLLSETFQKVLDDGCADRNSGYGHVEELIIDGHIIPNVGIKVRGNTSRCNTKRQFRFKFDAKEVFSVWNGQTEKKAFPNNKGRRFFGLEGLSIRASANDPTMIRERLSSRIFTNGESLAPTTRRGALVYRVAFTKVFVSFGRTAKEGPEGAFTRLRNGFYYDYKGLYSLSENIDETFLQTRFQDGNNKLKDFHLYSAALGGAHFDSARYSRNGWEQDFVNGKEPKDSAALTQGDQQLLKLFDLLKPTTSDSDIAAAIDVDSFATYVAAAQLSGHWDSLLANRNNDSLYFDGDSQKWKIITWDLDNSLGAQKAQYDQLMSDDIYHPATNNKGIIFEELFGGNRQVFKDLLKQRLKDYLTNFYAPANFNAMVDQLRDTVRDNAESWEGYSPQNYADLKKFADARRAKIGPQVGP